MHARQRGEALQGGSCHPRPGSGPRQRPHGFYQGLVAELIAFGRWRWQASTDAGDGASVGAHLAVLRKRAGAKANLGPTLPVEGAFIWHCYSELDDARQVGMAFAPISEADLYYYAANRNFRFLPFELAALRALDRAHRVFVAERQRELTQKPKPLLTEVNRGRTR